MSSQYEIDVSVPVVQQKVSAAVHRPKDVDRSTPVVVLGHGITNDRRHPLIASTLERLADRGVAGVRFNFPFKERGDEAPDANEVLRDTFTAVVQMVHERFLGDPPVILGGKSMGARVAAAHQNDHRLAAGMLYLGFPLHAPDDKDNLRGDDLTHIQVPQLCLQGDRDPFCDLDLFEKVHRAIDSPWQLEVFEGGGHGLGLGHGPVDEAGEALLDRVADLSVAWIRAQINKPDQ
jgi:predicted alpha/beta-hydrolase family hydrolase